MTPTRASSSVVKCTVVEGHRRHGRKFRTSSWCRRRRANEVVICDGCGYAANMDKAVSAASGHRRSSLVPLEKFDSRRRDHRRSRNRRTMCRKQIDPVFQADGASPRPHARRSPAQRGVGALGGDLRRPERGTDLLGAHPGSLARSASRRFRLRRRSPARTNLMTTGANEDGFHCAM